jgi:hypothetical protein
LIAANSALGDAGKDDAGFFGPQCSKWPSPMATQLDTLSGGL